MTDINSIEKWVIGEDKKPIFTIPDLNGTAQNITGLDGYGVIIFNPLNQELGRYGTSGMTGFSTGEITGINATSFSVSLDHSLNTMEGIYEYRVMTVKADASFTDNEIIDLSENREPLYMSTEL